ncbi:MAG: AbrB/MazE/SpoVT family DNA-binding domain-containing protein [Acidobacteria bacterium]|nr:AbrB/MazE/SpoVT family DNA-binding domain-containing protein [Acidobacteriota bacterium]
MRVAQSRVTRQGQISIPAAVRRELDIGPGTELIWDRGANGEYVIRPKRRALADIHALLEEVPLSRQTDDDILKARRDFMAVRTRHPAPAAGD